MGKRVAVYGVILGLYVVLSSVFTLAEAAGHGKAAEKKTGILLVAFGSSKPEAQVAFDNIDRMVNEKFKGIPVRWAYTSHIIRKKLAKQGILLDSPEVAVAKMIDENFTHVAVQSLHTIIGYEYDDLRHTVDAFKIMGAFDNIILGEPLLAAQEDMARAVDAVLATIPPDRKKRDAVLLMGHGSHHPANAFYAALMFQVQLKDPNIYIGTVEGFPEIDLIKSWLQDKNIKKAYLMPFMSVAGDHARKDMAGPEEDSWLSVLTKAGIECVPVLKGTAEYDEYVNIWVSHIEKSLAHF
ncbi:MAG: sirohydrochlorin cobaltochelatase [Desulfobacteraceae bacterium]|nr:sirohydrochlorin cobaltochelatase [Desulfobacteraceae bacterium]